MAKEGIYVANTSFVADVPDGGKDDDGNPTTQRLAAKTGQRFGANHPLVKLALKNAADGAPSYFDSEDGAGVVNYGPPEAATAAPGEVRNR